MRRVITILMLVLCCSLVLPMLSGCSDDSGDGGAGDAMKEASDKAGDAADDAKDAAGDAADKAGDAAKDATTTNPK